MRPRDVVIDCSCVPPRLVSRPLSVRDGRSVERHFFLPVFDRQSESIVMTTVAGQLELPMKPPMQELDVAMVSRQSSLTGAILLCTQIAGLEDKESAAAVKLDNAHWTRMKSGQAHFPQDRLNTLMDVCGNEAPLIWLANRRGYSLTPLETEWQRQARIEREARERVEAENRLLRSLLTNGRVA